MDIGHVLSMFPPIVENIFKYLNQHELEDCAQVCNLWKTMAEIERRRRKGDILSFFHVLSGTFMGNHFQERHMKFILGNSSKQINALEFEELRLNAKFCIAFALDNLSEVYHRLHVLNLRRPISAVAMYLAQKYIAQNEEFVRQVFKLFLPEKCETILHIAPGIIGCHESIFVKEDEEIYGISGIMIPFVQDLQIFNFKIDETSNISKVIPEGVNVKCLLVFAMSHESYGKIIKSCFQRQNSEFAVGGSLIRGTEPERGGFVVAFCGDGVQAASIIIKPITNILSLNITGKVDKEIEKKLMLFKKTGLLKYRCFAFMFTSAPVGQWHMKSDIEWSIFHKLYPQIPLIGVFGNGEIGFDYLPNIPCENKYTIAYIRKLIGCGNIYLQKHTTMFVLISLKI